MAQKTSQEFDSGLGSLREVEEELANGIAAIKLEEPVAKQKDQEKQRRSLVGNLESENRRLKEKLESMEVEVKQQKEQHATDARNLKDVKRQFGGQIEDLRKKHATDARNLKDVKRQFGDQIEDLRKKLAIEKENSKDVKRQLGVQIEDLHKKLAKKEAEVKELKKQITKLENEICHLNYLRGKNEIENSELKEKTVVQWKFCQMLVRCTPPESGYILIMLDFYMRCAGIEYHEAYRHLREAFTEHAPERPFPEPEDLEKLRQMWKEWYDKTTPPCFIKTVCDWYGKEASEIPYCYFGYIPGIHQNVSEEFIQKHFYIVYFLEFEERRKMSVELFEKNYVICYHKVYGDGHMCVGSKPELEYMIDNENLALFEPKDTVFGQDMRAVPRSITRFYLCLPRGTSIIDPDDIGYKVMTFQSLQELPNFPFSENEYEVKVTSSEGHVEKFRVAKENVNYCTEWCANDQAVYTKVELYLKKGISPFKNQPSLTFV